MAYMAPVSTLTQAPLGSAADDRMRPLLLIWAAAPAVASVAYLTTFGAQANLQVFILLHWMAVGIILVLLWCCYRPFMGRMPFDMSIWAAGFPTAALAVSALTYYQAMPGNLSYSIAVAALAGSSLVNGVMLLQTVAAVIRRRVSACILHERCASTLPTVATACAVVVLPIYPLSSTISYSPLTPARNQLDCWTSHTVTSTSRAAAMRTLNAHTHTLPACCRACSPPSTSGALYPS
jgi:hypothetical protein